MIRIVKGDIKMSKTFNIKPEDATYFINEEKKVVVCTIENTKKLFIHFAMDNFKIRPAVLGNDSFFKKLEMPDRFVGIAYCSKNDEWNSETGKLIAFSRMKDKLNKSFFKRANLYINTLDKWTDEAFDILNQIGAKLEVNTMHRHNLIDSILGAKEE